MDKLNGSLEFVNFALHHLLGANCEVLEREFNPSALHDLFTLLNGLFLTIFSNFPKFVGQDIGSLMELFLGLIVLTHIWLLIGESIEFVNELIQNLLFAIPSLKIGQELNLDVVEILLNVLPLKSLFLQGTSHLCLVGRTCGLPKLHQDVLEIGINVSGFRSNFILGEL